jgi:hypothetical protein
MANFLANAATLEIAPLTYLTAGATLPQATINVTDTTLFPTSGSVTIGANTVTYTGKTATTLTGAAGGSGAVNAGDRVVGAYANISAYSNDAGIDTKVGEAETTTYGIVDKKFIPALREGTAKFMILHDDLTYAGSPQALIYNYLGASGSQFPVAVFRVRPRGVGTGRPEISFDGFLTGGSDVVANDGSPVSTSVTVRASGAITRAAQS